MPARFMPARSKNNHPASGNDPSRRQSDTESDTGSDTGSDTWPDAWSNDWLDTESSADSHDNERTALDETSNMLKQVIKAWKTVSLIILINLLFNTLLICITHSPIAPLVFAGILSGLSSLALWKFWKKLQPLSLKSFIPISIVLSPFILPPLILSIPMISTPLVNMSSLYAWAFIGISALIYCSYRKCTKQKQASSDNHSYTFDDTFSTTSSCSSDFSAPQKSSSHDLNSTSVLRLSDKQSPDNTSKDTHPDAHNTCTLI
jgi:hypothetical protein